MKILNLLLNYNNTQNLNGNYLRDLYVPYVSFSSRYADNNYKTVFYIALNFIFVIL